MIFEEVLRVNAELIQFDGVIFAIHVTLRPFNHFFPNGILIVGSPVGHGAFPDEVSPDILLHFIVSSLRVFPWRK